MNVNIGKGIALDIDTAKIPANVMDHVVMIGLRNILMDSHAGITKETHPDNAARTDAAKGVAMKKLDAMLAGELRTAGTRTGAADSVGKEMERLAKLAVTNAVRAKGVKLADVKDRVAGWVNAYVAKHEADLRAQATANLAKASEGAADIDLGDLGL